MTTQLTVTISPHVRSGVSARRIMWSVFIALLPAGAWGVYAFGMRALAVIMTAIVSAVAAEVAIQALRKREITLIDGSAALTGLLLAYNLPPNVPLWIPVVGSFFAIAIAKQIFGGLGSNIFTPALAGRAFLLASWPVYMTTWSAPRWHIDAVTAATPLRMFQDMGVDALGKISKVDLFIGNRGGCIGELCVAALLLGAVYLLVKGYISWHIPLSYVGTVALLSWIFNGNGALWKGDSLFFVMSGGLILGAFFMATDYVTSPMTSRGRLVFGLGCGLLTFIIRRFCGYPEGVSYSILIMNAATPMIDRMTFPKWFGYVKKKR